MLGPWFGDASADAANQLSENVRRRQRQWLGRVPRTRRGMGELHPPHNKPPMMQWRTHGRPADALIEAGDGSRSGAAVTVCTRPT